MNSQIVLWETFDLPDLDSRLAWHCPPKKWRIDRSRLIVEPEAKTDFWQKTHYGFEADNGPFLHLPVAGDFILSTEVHFFPIHQYDQAGLMIRVTAQCWLKTSVEFEPDGPNRLGSVVTNQGYSDWATQNFPREVNELALRVRRKGGDYIVEVADPAEEFNWIQIRMAHLDSSEVTVMAGLYACSPIDSGFCAEFDYLRIERGRTVR